MYNLCCISNELKKQDFNFQKMTWKQFRKLRTTHGEEYALEQLGERWVNNVAVTLESIKHCAKNGWGYRVSSSLFPLLTHPDFSYSISDFVQYDEIMSLFDDIIEFNKHTVTTTKSPYLNSKTSAAQVVRLSIHPDQFNVLASENQSAVDKTIRELNHHGWLMDKLGCERSYYNPINIHVNCTKGDPADIAARFMSNLNRCDQSVTSRLVVENEDKGCWTIANLLNHFDIPITYDNLHNKCNPSPKPYSMWEEGFLMKLCANTWGKVKPVFHLSESHPDKKNPRSHADMPTFAPPISLLVDADYDCEYKGKDFAIREMIRLSQDCPLCQELTNER